MGFGWTGSYGNLMAADLAARYVSRLEELAGMGRHSNIDRSALAALRRSIPNWPVVSAEAMRVVVPFLTERKTDWSEQVCYLIGGLFALYPCRPALGARRGASLGAALAEAAKREPAQGAERRFIALLSAKREALPSQLRHAVAYLQARGVPVDYRCLMRDLMGWESTAGQVQCRWGRDFWRAAEPKVSVGSESVGVR
jgi:CRISPR type I-E-associated protein CasB/Cse2